jgi:hypothetical protein
MTHAQRRLLDTIYQAGAIGFATDVRETDSIICTRLLRAGLVTRVQQGDTSVWTITDAGITTLKTDWGKIKHNV